MCVLVVVVGEGGSCTLLWLHLCPACLHRSSHHVACRRVLRQYLPANMFRLWHPPLTCMSALQQPQQPRPPETYAAQRVHSANIVTQRPACSPLPNASPHAQAMMLDVEADCYWCLSKLLDGIQDHYTDAQPGIQRTVFKVKELVRWGRVGGWGRQGVCRHTG